MAFPLPTALSALALLPCCVGYYESGSNVHRIKTSQQWKDKVRGSNYLWVVEFYRETCGFCSLFEPEMEKAATDLKHLVYFAGINVEKEPGFTQKVAQKFGFQISGVPTVKVFSPTSAGPADYSGERKAGPLKKFALGLQPSFVVTVEGRSFDDFLASHPQQRKAILLTPKREQSSLLKAISCEFRGRVLIGQAKADDAVLLRRLGLGAGGSAAVGAGDFPLLLAIRREADEHEPRRWQDEHFPGGAEFARLSLADKKGKATFRQLEYFLMPLARAPARKPPKKEL